MDEREATLTALLNEFGARWTELQNIEVAIMTWTTIYATALFAGGAWVWARLDVNRAFLQRTNQLIPFVVLLICITNTMFFLAMVTMSYRIQEIALYTHGVLTPRIRALTDGTFNSWELFRRNSPAAWGRDLYAVLQGMLPVAISIVLLVLYFRLFWNRQRPLRVHSLLAYATIVLLALAVFSSAAMTADAKARWREALAPEKAERTKTP